MCSNTYLLLHILIYQNQYDNLKFCKCFRKITQFRICPNYRIDPTAHFTYTYIACSH